ncbi:MAG: ABC transporter permease [Verrucomicrobiales bacterium]
MPAATAEFTVENGKPPRLVLGGDWRIGAAPPLPDLRGSCGLSFDLSAVGEWDSSLPSWVVRAIESAEDAGLEPDLKSLPEGVAKLVALARAVPERATGDKGGKPNFVERIGAAAQGAWRGGVSACDFTGNAAISLAKTLAFRTPLRWRDFFALIQECGASALGIVALISFLTGLILAFVGAVQLRLFGAEIYVADLVAIAMAREMAALMPAIIMAGRSGAAFAAHLGTMKVSEEIDALTTFGFSPFDLLATPRLIALTLMMPLLCLYSDAIGILGGIVIAWGMLDLPMIQYWNETVSSLHPEHVIIGVVKATAFGLLIAASGCYYGMRCGSNAAAVGRAATSAVVAGIVLIVIADAIFAVLCHILDV